MKIGIIHPYFNILGGAENTTLSLLRKLGKTDHSISVYCISPPMLENMLNVTIKKIPKKKFPLFSAYQRLKEIDQIFNSAKSDDLIIVMSGGLALPKKSNSNIIVYCNSVFSEELKFINKKYTGIKSLYYNFLKKEIEDRISFLQSNNVRLISNSNYTKTEFHKHFSKDSTIVYPPVNMKRFEKYYNYPKIPKVVTISRFSTEKNLELGIDILNSTDIKYEIIGKVGNNIQQKIFSDLKNHSNKNITFHTNISPSNMENILSTSMVYFHPSIETFGISVVEAIFAGCIPIVPNNSAHQETVPFNELRFNNKNEAIEKIKLAISGEYDYLKYKLHNHVKNFSEEIFHERFLKQLDY